MESSKTRKVYDKLINEMYSFLYHKSLQSDHKQDVQAKEGESNQAVDNKGCVYSNEYCYKKMVDSTGNTRQFVSKLRKSCDENNDSKADFKSNIDSENIHTKENYYNVKARIQKEKDDYQV